MARYLRCATLPSASFDEFVLRRGSRLRSGNSRVGMCVPTGVPSLDRSATPVCPQRSRVETFSGRLQTTRYVMVVLRHQTTAEETPREASSGISACLRASHFFAEAVKKCSLVVMRRFLTRERSEAYPEKDMSMRMILAAIHAKTWAWNESSGWVGACRQTLLPVCVTSS